MSSRHMQAGGWSDFQWLTHYTWPIICITDGENGPSSYFLTAMTMTNKTRLGMTQSEYLTI